MFSFGENGKNYEPMCHSLPSRLTKEVSEIKDETGGHKNEEPIRGLAPILRFT